MGAGCRLENDQGSRDGNSSSSGGSGGGGGSNSSGHEDGGSKPGGELDAFTMHALLLLLNGVPFLLALALIRHLLSDPLLKDFHNKDRLLEELTRLQEAHTRGELPVPPDSLAGNIADALFGWHGYTANKYAEAARRRERTQKEQARLLQQRQGAEGSAEGMVADEGSAVNSATVAALQALPSPFPAR
jgi:hypothetical protein